MPDSTFIYWDACAFLSYVNDHPKRADVLEAILEEIERPETGRRLVTSVLSQTEVSHIYWEADFHSLDPAADEKIMALWAPGGIVTLVELHSEIALQARHLMRQGLSRRLPRLKPGDAIHLATAMWVQATEFHTYDGKLKEYSRLIGCTVCEPYVLQPKLLPAESHL